MNLNKKIIFTFWEPREKIPGYLSLCIRTWKKFLPDYKIIVLDYKKVKEYLGKELFSKIICRNMSTMVQTDAIRVAILYKFGGIWMDSDNIITNGQFIKKIKVNESAMIMDKRANYPFIAFIYASKNAFILHEWLKQIIINVQKFKDINLQKKNKPKLISNENINIWYYLGNGILNNIIKNLTEKKFYGFDHKNLSVFPELQYIKNSSLHFREKYRLFFYEKGDPKLVLNTSKDLVFLQNSWTPSKYKIMSENEFLHQDILLSRLFKLLLNITI